MSRLGLGLGLTAASTAVLVLTTAPLALACTGGALTATDGGVAVGRTLEFGKPLDSQIAVWPAGSSFTGSSNRGKGLSYRSRYGFVGATAAQYTPEARARQARTLIPTQLGTWLLANFASVEEVKAGLSGVDLTAQVISLLGAVPDVHFKVQDASGKSIVIEPRDGRLLVHDNPTRVLTNAPTFPWHLTNLINYLTVSSAYAPASTIGAPGAGQLKLTPFGMGAGSMGLPGDFSPPSRFVRMVFFTQNASRSPTTMAAVGQLFHILKTFDIPLGVARPPAGRAEVTPDYTTWTSVSNLRDLIFNWKTFGDQRVRTLDLRQALSAAGGQLKLLPMGPQQPDAVSPTLEVRLN